MQRVSAPNPVLFKGQLYFIIKELYIFFHLFTSFQNELVLLHHSKVPNTSFLYHLWTYGFKHFYVLIHCLILIINQTAPSLASGFPFKLGPESLVAFLLSVVIRYSRLILCISCTCPEISHFSKELCLFFLVVMFCTVWIVGNCFLGFLLKLT